MTKLLQEERIWNLCKIKLISLKNWLSYSQQKVNFTDMKIDTTIGLKFKIEAEKLVWN